MVDGRIDHVADAARHRVFGEQVVGVDADVELDGRAEDVGERLVGRPRLVRVDEARSLVGTLLRRDGFRVPSGAARNFLLGLEALDLPACLPEEVSPLPELVRALDEQIRRADERLADVVRDDEDVARLCAVPGVGPITATGFASTLDDVSRFSVARQVRAYLVLVPSEYSSGEKQQRGGISKAGPRRARSMLVEAGWRDGTSFGEESPHALSAAARCLHNKDHWGKKTRPWPCRRRT